MTLETKVVGFAMQYRCLCSTRLTKEPTHPLQQHDTPTAWADSPDAAWLAWQAVYILTH
jgi:hypothetical protein